MGRSMILIISFRSVARSARALSSIHFLLASERGHHCPKNIPKPSLIADTVAEMQTSCRPSLCKSTDPQQNIIVHRNSSSYIPFQSITESIAFHSPILSSRPDSRSSKFVRSAPQFQAPGVSRFPQKQVITSGNQVTNCQTDPNSGCLQLVSSWLLMACHGALQL